MVTYSIAARNDALRAAMPLLNEPDALVITRGVARLGGEVIAEVLRKVHRYDDFTPDNDPWGEHDFGVVEHAGHRFFWKIDDHGMQDGFRLVLTVMMNSEY